MSYEFNWILPFSIKLFFKWKYDKHFIYVFLNLFDSILFPSPYLRRNIINGFIPCQFSKFGNSHIEAWIVNKNKHIRFIAYNILFTFLNKPKDLWQVPKDFDKSHKSGIFVMFDLFTIGNSLHFITSPKSKHSASISFGNGLHKIGAVQVSACLTCYEVVFH